MQSGTQAGFGLRAPIWLDPYKKPNPTLTGASTSWFALGSADFMRQGRIEIQERFWPYQRLPGAVTEDSEAYVAAVRRLFLRHACVSSSFSPADERLAADWRRRGISFERVERAIYLGVARKYIALVNNGKGTPITTLRYFEHLIEEVDQSDVSPSYWRHVMARTEQFERRWRSLRAASRPSSTLTEETK